MKRIISLTISAVLLLTLASCAAETAPENPSPPGTDINPPTTSVVDTTPPDVSQATPSANTPGDSPTPFDLSGMPVPFEHTGGDDNFGFRDPHVFKLTLYSPMDEDIADYLGLTIMGLHERLEEVFGDIWEQFERPGLIGRDNLFGLIIEFDIPNDIVAESLQMYNESQELFAVEAEENGWFGNAVYYRDRKFTDAEIEALLSRDEATVLKHFATEYAIVIEDRAYSPFWLYLHTPEDYEREGITAGMVEEKLDSYGEFNLTLEAADAFEEKLSEFIGESVTLERR